jgi:hypothetical protein
VPAASRSRTVQGETERNLAVVATSRRRASALPLASEVSGPCAGDVSGPCPDFRGRPTGRRAWSRGRSSLTLCSRLDHRSGPSDAPRCARINDRAPHGHHPSAPPEITEHCLKIPGCEFCLPGLPAQSSRTPWPSIR